MSDEKKKVKLSPRYELFANYYVGNGFNGAEACRKAKYVDNKNGSIYVTASKLLSNPNIQARIRELQDELASGIIFNKYKTLQRCDKFIYADIRELFEEVEKEVPEKKLKNKTVIPAYKYKKIVLKDITKLPEDIASCVASVRFKNGEISEVKLVDKMRGLELMADAQGLRNNKEDKDSGNSGPMEIKLTIVDGSKPKVEDAK